MGLLLMSMIHQTMYDINDIRLFASSKCIHIIPEMKKKNEKKNRDIIICR